MAAANYGIDIVTGFGATGNAQLIANFTPDGSLATATWSICVPQTPFASAQSHDGILNAGVVGHSSLR